MTNPNRPTYEELVAVLKEFVADIDDSGGLVKNEFEALVPRASLDWPDLAQTYLHATSLLERLLNTDVPQKPFCGILPRRPEAPWRENPIVARDLSLDEAWALASAYEAASDLWWRENKARYNDIPRGFLSLKGVVDPYPQLYMVRRVSGPPYAFRQKHTGRYYWTHYSAFAGPADEMEPSPPYLEQEDLLATDWLVEGGDY